MWQTAYKLRGHMDAAEYKHAVSELIFLKYISDAFQEKYADLEARRTTDYVDPKDRDEYASENIFWVPQEARWSQLQANAKQQSLIDDAMVAIEQENHSLKGVLSKGYSKIGSIPNRNTIISFLIPLR